ncbi:hypothetical protein COOONC_06125 [Cooperia oncophora]
MPPTWPDVVALIRHVVTPLNSSNNKVQSSLLEGESEVDAAASDDPLVSLLDNNVIQNERISHGLNTYKPVDANVTHSDKKHVMQALAATQLAEEEEAHIRLAVVAAATTQEQEVSIQLQLPLTLDQHLAMQEAVEEDQVTQVEAQAMLVEAEAQAMPVEAEDRAMLVAAEAQAMPVVAEDRAMPVEAEDKAMLKEDMLAEVEDMLAEEEDQVIPQEEDQAILEDQATPALKEATLVAKESAGGGFDNANTAVESAPAAEEAEEVEPAGGIVVAVLKISRPLAAGGRLLDQEMPIIHQLLMNMPNEIHLDAILSDSLYLASLMPPLALKTEFSRLYRQRARAINRRWAPVSRYAITMVAAVGIAGAAYYF